MANLVYSDVMKRKVRLEPWGEIGVSTVTKIKEAINAGRLQEALDLVDYINVESKPIHDLYCDWAYADLDFIANKFGEEQVYHALRYAFNTVGQSSFFKGLLGAKSVEEALQIVAESYRGHHMGPKEEGDITILDKGDRYVLIPEICGSGGRMRMIGVVDGTPPRTGPPYNLGVTKKAYPWSWGKAGVPYYCLHCCVWSEIIATERNGYPARITLYSEDPYKPCHMVYYKNPEDIPEQFFARIGFKKDVSRMKKRG
mgnify:CR=1 FL=1